MCLEPQHKGDRVPGPRRSASLAESGRQLVSELRWIAVSPMTSRCIAHKHTTHKMLDFIS